MGSCYGKASAADVTGHYDKRMNKNISHPKEQKLPARGSGAQEQGAPPLVVNILAGWWIVCSQVLIWLAFFFIINPGSLSVSDEIGGCLAFIAVLAVVRDAASTIRRTSNYWLIAFKLINASLLIVGVFAAVYLGIGTPRNFGMSLSRIDAIYFTLGTLTSQGTGTIMPTSDLARMVVSIQMIVDVLFVVIALGIAVAKWSEGGQPATDNKRKVTHFAPDASFNGAASVNPPSARR